MQDTARQAGLTPPRTFGTEVVARFLGLRTNHPAQDDALELYPWEPITRAEAAHSLAVVMQSGDWAAENARAQLGAFTLPSYDAKTKRALRDRRLEDRHALHLGRGDRHDVLHVRLPGARRL